MSSSIWKHSEDFNRVSQDICLNQVTMNDRQFKNIKSDFIIYPRIKATHGSAPANVYNGTLCMLIYKGMTQIVTA